MRKLILPVANSQRDSRWGSILLGNNTLSQYNIYNYGCLITSLGNYIGQTPAQVNTHKDMFVSGGGDFIWSKCSSIGLNEVYSSPRYNDAVTDAEIAKMRAFIDQGKPLITEVDFNPSTVSEEMHYILIIGYDDNGEFIILDPWTGSVVSLAVYGGVQRAVYSYRVYDRVLAFETVSGTNECAAKLTQALSDLDAVTKDRNRLNDVIGKVKDPQIADLAAKLATANASVASISAQKDSLSVQLGECQRQSAIYKAEYDRAIGDTGYIAQIEHLETDKKTLGSEITTLNTKLTKITNSLTNLRKSGLKFIQYAVIKLCEKFEIDL